MEWYRKVNPVTPTLHAENPGKKPDPPIVCSATTGFSLGNDIASQVHPTARNTDDTPRRCPTRAAMLFFVQRRLLNFFSAVRNESWQLQWCFTLITKDDGVWTEAMLIQRGLPVNWICLIEANVSCSFNTQRASGFFTTNRTVNPRKVAWNIVRESEALVADVQAEFAGRLWEHRQY